MTIGQANKGLSVEWMGASDEKMLIKVEKTLTRHNQSWKSQLRKEYGAEKPTVGKEQTNSERIR